MNGYFGTPDNYLVALVSTETGETLLARVGRRFPEFGLTLTHFEVKKVPVAHGETWPVYDVAGFATLRADNTGAEVVLDSRTQKWSDSPGVLLEASPPTNDAHPVTIVGKPAGVSDFPAPFLSERSQ